MKIQLLLILPVLLSVPPAVCADPVASARTSCLSLVFERGSDGVGVYSLDLTTLVAGINKELAPIGDFYSHSSRLLLNDEIFGDDPVPGVFEVDLPPYADANGNGFDDFFEVSQGVSGSSEGGYAFPTQSGGVQATWTRAAGSRFGTCLLDFLQGAFLFARFTHTFELVEYAGPMTYIPGSSTVPAQIDLASAGNPSGWLRSQVTFVKSATNRFNELLLQRAPFTNALGQVLTCLDTPILRQTLWPTNYRGLLEFVDGNTATTEKDYELWVLSIDDPNDADADGIPDFSDDPAGTVPRAPELALARGETNLWMTIRGDAGYLHEIQEAPTPTGPLWIVVASLTLTNGPQTIRLPLPSGTTYWRARALVP